MAKDLRSVTLSYGLAIVTVALVLELTLWLRPLFDPLPSPLFFAAIMISAWVGGLGPGLLATLLSTLGLHYLFGSTVAAQGAETEYISRLGVFTLVALFTTLLNDRRVQIENALRSNEERFRTVITHNADGIVIVDTSGLVYFINPTAEVLLGRSAADMCGSLFGFPLVVGETTELDLSRHDGTPGVVEMCVTEIQWEGRKAFLASLRDVTTRKQMEAALRIANAELEQRVQERTMQLQRLNADLRQVAYVSAHDLTEPVRMVGAYTQLLASRYRGKLDAQAEGYIDYIIEGATRSHAQLKDLLDYVEVETVPRPFTATDCEAVYTEVLEVLQPEIRGSAAVVTHEPLPTVQATQMQIALVFSHLLENALKFRNATPPQ